ncbi:MAG: hypothetical protein M3P70_04120 [Actinomycetota bacterium]|nr:hypothetical protein [Actinomycetota bacterium]
MSHHAPVETATRSDNTPTNVLRGRRLLVARVAWVAVALLTVGLFVGGTSLYWMLLQEVCTQGAEACTEKGLITPENVRQLEALGLSTGFYAAYNVVLTVASTTVWCVVGALIFWRRSDDRMALLVSLFLVVFGAATFSGNDSALVERYPAFGLPFGSMEFLGEVLAALFFYTFPSGRFVPRWTRWMAAAYLASVGPQYFFPDSPLYTNALADRLGFAVFALTVVSFVFAQVYRYRKVSGPMERRQTKWVVFGVVAAIASFFASLSPFIFIPSDEIPVSYLTLVQLAGLNGSMTLIPLSIGVAVLRYRLFDVDVLINRALVYGALTASLALVYLGSVVTLQYAFRAVSGQESQLTIVASTLAVAALFNPLRRGTQAFIDRRFYRRKYDAAKTLAAFNARLRDETELDTLSGDVVGVVKETMQPAHVSLWLRSPTEAGASGEPAK